MAHVIAVAGKGGVGKTTLTGLFIQRLCESRKGPLLVVDADANANLNEVLGVEMPLTLGEVREEIERAGSDPKIQIPVSMTKKEYLEYRIEDALVEEAEYDLMVMGRSQGAGCYCFVNNLVQAQIQALQNNYPYIVVDNEAGMEPAEDRYDAPGQRLFQERHPGGWADRGACEGTEDRSCIYGAHRKPGAGREIERGDGRGDPKTGIDALRGRPTG